MYANSLKMLCHCVCLLFLLHGTSGNQKSLSLWPYISVVLLVASSWSKKGTQSTLKSYLLQRTHVLEVKLRHLKKSQ